MSIDGENDPILDACLDEVLGGRTPPDLSPRILRTIEARGQDEKAAPKLPSITPPVVLSGPAARREQRRQPSSLVLLVGLAAGFVGLGITVGVVMLVNSNRQEIAQQPVDQQKGVAATPAAEPATTSFPPQPITPQPEPATTLAVQPAATAPADIPSPTPVAVSPAVDLPQAKNSSDAVAAAPAPKRYTNPTPNSQIVSFVNTELGRAWSDAGVKPSPAANDAQWCERLFVSLLGRAPTAAELKALADDKAADRREKLVHQLLTQPAYAEEYANHWSTVWTNVFIGKIGGQGGSLASREHLQEYFRAALVVNKPYHEMAQELLTATGSARPGPDDHNPAVNFLLDRLNADATFPTSRVARVMLGHQLQCAQCHEHPTRGWSQEQFWAFNSFFRQMRSQRVDGGARLVNVDFRARAGRPGDEVFYEAPDGLMKTALPRFIDGTTISPSGELTVVDRRRELAKLVVQSNEFSRAAVNRVWAQLFDYGFTRPLDDLGSGASITAPQTLDRLATEFSSHGFDLKQLIRWSVLSDPFGRSNKLADLASKDMPEEGELALFSRDYARPPQLAGVFGALVQASRIRNSAGSKTEVDKARIDWLTQANRGLGQGGVAQKGGKRAIPATSQSLLMKTEGPIRQAGGDPTGLVKKLIVSTMPFDKKVEHVFLLAVARQPSARERKAATDLLGASKDNQASTLEDIWWALANSNECVIDR